MYRGVTFYNIMLYTGDWNMFYIGFCRFCLYSCGNKTICKPFVHYNQLKYQKKEKQNQIKWIKLTVRNLFCGF